MRFSIGQDPILFNKGAPYQLQVENTFDYVVNKLGVKNPATGIIYQNDEHGQNGLMGYKEAVSAYQLGYLSR